MHIKESVIIITAAGSPVGRRLALHFASLGTEIALIDTDIDALHVTYKDCIHYHHNVEVFHLQNTQQATIKQLLTSVYRRFGRFNILINSWPKSADIPNLLAPDAITCFTKVMCNGATTFFAFGNVAASFMQHTKLPALIINLAVKQPHHQPQLPDTCKCVVQGLTQSWSKELAEKNIRVGGIIPINSPTEASNDTQIHAALLDEIVSSIEYMIRNESFNGRVLEAESAI
ncbi:SDR family NAD(P)-dependent oxidoreductase [Photobacterium lucens]|uniref:SDR family NAD(P)-dependent oxidoreductase n=1 Tax=Photobacterium lucens TaxID=2562949 RepID=UPI00136ADF2E|nr:SDR family NAD(P)-dependent oxidoreductase [Photobacterium lucens]MBP2699436.1 SDR family NAD(P)-dependent oxidoreductase [Vibrio parahaemolyticus]MZG58151.1 SDR family NAD(P)-dependent oxidoreductase [Photobacterium lucens]MZG82251.1 SDR family NAD(P)-dependent oxidoreductase [Photobacterium lucens]